MALDPEAMEEAVLRGLEAKTGRGLDLWKAALDGAGPFAKPALAVAWLKAQGMGHVTAQVVERRWRGASISGGTVEEVLGSEGAALFATLETRLRGLVPGLRVGVRKGYVTLGTSVQFAVVTRVPQGGGLRIGLVAQAEGPALPPAPPIGGSARFGLLLELSGQNGVDRALAHLSAAAGSKRGQGSGT